MWNKFFCDLRFYIFDVWPNCFTISRYSKWYFRAFSFKVWGFVENVTHCITRNISPGVHLKSIFMVYNVLIIYHVRKHRQHLKVETPKSCSVSTLMWFSKKHLTKCEINLNVYCCGWVIYKYGIYGDNF